MKEMDAPGAIRLAKHGGFQPAHILLAGGVVDGAAAKSILDANADMLLVTLNRRFLKQPAILAHIALCRGLMHAWRRRILTAEPSIPELSPSALRRSMLAHENAGRSRHGIA
ncbi:MAG: hypothetical protein WD793_15060 [Steroidobacteraceae bacterium]